MTYEPGEPVSLVDDGLLWLINRAVFHPRGFALGYTPGTGAFVLLGDGSEVWNMGSINEDERFAAVEAALQRARKTMPPDIVAGTGARDPMLDEIVRIMSAPLADE